MSILRGHIQLRTARSVKPKENRATLSHTYIYEYKQLALIFDMIMHYCLAVCLVCLVAYEGQCGFRFQ